jgi:hypothetical protein
MAGPGRAGLYSITEPPHDYRIPKKGIRAVPVDRFRQDWLVELRGISVPLNLQPQQPGQPPPPETVRNKYLQRRDELQRKLRRGESTIEDRIDLSYYLIRLGELEEAFRVLRDPQIFQESRRDPQAQRKLFLVYANQATIYQMWANSGSVKDRVRNLALARFALKDALRSWPNKSWPGWDKQQMDWYKEVEQFNLALIEQRLKEARERSNRKESNKDRPFETVDAIFPLHWEQQKKKPLRFVREDGAYHAGQLAAAERAKLTGNEDAIVMQLLTWLPQDDRLYWLLGELQNIKEDDQQGNGDKQQEVNKQRGVQTAAAILDDCIWNRKVSNVPELMDHWTILRAALTPVEKTWWEQYWHYVVVGGVGALVVLALAYFQIRENRRRRALRSQGSAVRGQESGVRSQQNP